MDAKIYCMIEDMSRGGLMDLLGHPITEEHSHNYLASVVRQQYETGQIPAEDIIATWDDDGPECR